MLTERQLEVLLSVVYEFIESGEHVGSRTVSKRYLTGRSAATIRNEMADLEEMGYLMQPHTSSGRVPTTRAYRLFVDTVLQRRRSRDHAGSEWFERVEAHRDGLQGALSTATEMLTDLSRYVGVAAITQLGRAKLNKIDFIRVDSSHVLLLVILEGGVVHNKMVSMPFDLSQESLADLSARINMLSGHPWDEVRSAIHSYIRSELGKYEESCRRAIAELDDLLTKDHTSLYTGSLANLVNIPDFQDIGRFKALFSVLEEENSLIDLLSKAPTTDGIGVMIGGEDDLPELEDCSLVLSSSSIEGCRTMLGVIGPKRMNYEKVITILDRVLQDLVNCSDEGVESDVIKK